mmetsp:Transcript_12345/g.26041  ORF Transcript_12345/g.26041 Transcript_12345/m.26041 type:complete len:274 (-) Transcript_12345:162-983(-)
MARTLPNGPPRCGALMHGGIPSVGSRRTRYPTKFLSSVGRANAAATTATTDPAATADPAATTTDPAAAATDSTTTASNPTGATATATATPTTTTTATTTTTTTADRAHVASSVCRSKHEHYLRYGQCRIRRILDETIHVVEGLAPPILFAQGKQAVLLLQRILDAPRNDRPGSVHDRQVGRPQEPKAKLLRDLHPGNHLLVVRRYGTGKGRLDRKGRKGDRQVLLDVLQPVHQWVGCQAAAAAGRRSPARRRRQPRWWHLRPAPALGHGQRRR